MPTFPVYPIKSPLFYPNSGRSRTICGTVRCRPCPSGSDLPPSRYGYRILHLGDMHLDCSAGPSESCRPPPCWARSTCYRHLATFAVTTVRHWLPPTGPLTVSRPEEAREALRGPLPKRRPSSKSVSASVCGVGLASAGRTKDIGTKRCLNTSTVRSRQVDERDDRRCGRGGPATATTLSLHCRGARHRYLRTIRSKGAPVSGAGGFLASGTAKSRAVTIGRKPAVSSRPEAHKGDRDRWPGYQASLPRSFHSLCSHSLPCRSLDDHHPLLGDHDRRRVGVGRGDRRHHRASMMCNPSMPCTRNSLSTTLSGCEPIRQVQLAW